MHAATLMWLLLFIAAGLAVLDGGRAQEEGTIRLAEATDIGYPVASRGHPMKYIEIFHDGTWQRWCEDGDRFGVPRRFSALSEGEMACWAAGRRGIYHMWINNNSTGDYALAYGDMGCAPGSRSLADCTNVIWGDRGCHGSAILVDCYEPAECFEDALRFAHVMGATPQGEVQTLRECLRLCTNMGFECKAIDYDHQEFPVAQSHCWIHAGPELTNDDVVSASYNVSHYRRAAPNNACH